MNVRMRVTAAMAIVLVVGLASCVQAGTPDASQADPVAPIRYPDGIPLAIDGMPVLRGDRALAVLDSGTTSVSVLVGGWLTVTHGTRSCPADTGSQGWLWSCGQPVLSDVAGSDVVWPGADRALSFAFVRMANLRSGAAILRVHTRDARAGHCGSATDACARAVVVDAIPWNGDAVTAPHPLTAAVMQQVLNELQPGAVVTPLSDTTSQTDCGSGLPAGDIYPIVHAVNREPAVTWMGISPSAAAAARSVRVAQGVAGALSAAAVQSTGSGVSPSGSFRFACRWLRVANVALLVLTAPELTTEDRAFLEGLATAMESAAG